MALSATQNGVDRIWADPSLDRYRWLRFALIFHPSSHNLVLCLNEFSWLLSIRFLWKPLLTRRLFPSSNTRDSRNCCGRCCNWFLDAARPINRRKVVQWRQMERILGGSNKTNGTGSRLFWSSTDVQSHPPIRLSQYQTRSNGMARVLSLCPTEPTAANNPWRRWSRCSRGFIKLLASFQEADTHRSLALSTLVDKCLTPSDVFVAWNNWLQQVALEFFLFGA